MTTAKYFNYDLISKFKEISYKDHLFSTNITESEMFVGKAKDEHGEEIEVNTCFYPLKREHVSYLLPSAYLKELPIKVKSSIKISTNKKAYHMITDAVPGGFGAIKSFSSFREYVNQFCDYQHEQPIKFLLWRIIALTAYFKRINVRVSTPPAFGKDSIFKVLQGLGGEVGIVHNPSIPKVEWLLTNRVIMTNEVAGIKSDEIDNLQQYYLTCGDFSNIYEKRTVANYKGAQNTYNIQKLSNIVCYNDLDCYKERQKDKYFDSMFQRAVQERFLPFRFTGKIQEKEAFGSILNPEQFVEANIKVYKDNIKMLKYLVNNIDKEVHGYAIPEAGFQDRALRNWETICQVLDAYSENEKEFNQLASFLLECHKDYYAHYNKVVQGGDNYVEPKNQFLNKYETIQSLQEDINKELPFAVKEVKMNDPEKIEDELI